MNTVLSSEPLSADENPAADKAPLSFKIACKCMLYFILPEGRWDCPAAYVLKSRVLRTVKAVFWLCLSIVLTIALSKLG